MRKRKTRATMADDLDGSSSKTGAIAGDKPSKAPRVTPVPKGGRRPAATPTAAASYPAVPSGFRSWNLGSRFHIKRFLGKGSYGSVCEAIDKNTGNRVAIKRITNLFDVKENAKRIYREIRILHLLDHPNIIRIVHLHMAKERDFNDLYIVFECMDTDFGKLTYDVSQNLTIAHVRWLLYQLLLALKYIHSAGVIHRDLKPANVLITSSCDLKLCDFGLARSVGDTKEAHSDDEDDEDDDAAAVAPPMIHRQLTRHVVTRWYRAPELMLYNDGDYTTAIDVWSTGCVLGEMLGMLDNRDSAGNAIDREALFPGSSCYPLSGSAASPDPSRRAVANDQLSVIFDVLGAPSEATIAEAKEYLRKVTPRPKLSIFKRYPEATEEAMDLLQRMLVITPEKRITIDEALRHDFLKPVWRADEELARKHMINFDLIKEHDDLHQLIYREVTKYNLDEATKTCDVPYKPVPGEDLRHRHHHHHAASTDADESKAPSGAGAGAGAGETGGSATPVAPDASTVATPSDVTMEPAEAPAAAAGTGGSVAAEPGSAMSTASMVG